MHTLHLRRSVLLPLGAAFCLALPGTSLAQTTTTNGGTTTGGTTTTGTGGTIQGGTGTQFGAGAARVGAGTAGASPFAGSAPTGFATQATGGVTATTGQATGGALVIPTANNFINSMYGTYKNPYALGMAIMGPGGAKTTVANKAFGQAIYSIQTTTTTATGRGGATTTNQAAGFTTLNIRKAPRYGTALGEDLPVVEHAPVAMQSKLSNLLARSSRLKNRDQMRVDVQGSVVVLSGQAASETERRVAESVLRLEPGVIFVENRLTVPGQP